LERDINIGGLELSVRYEVPKAEEPTPKTDHVSLVD
jgi:hypothetical protein